MSHHHNTSWRPRRFRTFVTNAYWANRDEYDSAGQTQPHTFEQYVQENLSQLKQQYREHAAAVARARRVERWRKEWRVK
jgi:hypothetical protein